MKSAKVINKILLISLAFGSVTVVAGMLLAKGNLKKALVGVGATTALVGAAGSLTTKKARESDSGLEEKLQDSKLTSELNYQNYQEDKSEKSVKTNIKPEPVAEVESDLFPTEANREQQETFSLENSVDDSYEVSNESEQEELEQIVSPIEEVSADVDPQEDLAQQLSVETEFLDSESEFARDSIAESEESADESEDFNPFSSSSSLSESDSDEESADLETVDKLIGAFDPSEPDVPEESPIDKASSELTTENNEENEYGSQFGLEDNSEIATEIDSPTENLVQEPIFPAQSSESTEDLSSNSYSGHEIEDDAMPMEEDSASELIEELPMDSTSDDDLSFAEEPAGTDEMDSAEMSFDVMPMEEDSASEPIEELSMDLTSDDDLSFAEEPADTDEMNSAEMSFDVMPMEEDLASEPIEELSMDLTSDDDLSFAEEPASADEMDSESGLELDNEFELESTEEIENPVEEFSMGLDSTSDDDLSLLEDPSDTDEMNSAEMSFEDMSIEEDSASEPIEELSMDLTSDDDLSFAEEPAGNDQMDLAEMSFEDMSMKEDSASEPIEELSMDLAVDDDLSFAEEPSSNADLTSESGLDLDNEFELESTEETENPVEEFSMGLDSTSDDELSFAEEPAGTDEMDLAEMSFEDMSMEEDSASEPIEELSMDLTSDDDLSFSEEPSSNADLTSESGLDLDNEFELKSTEETENPVEEFSMGLDSTSDDELSFSEEPAGNDDLTSESEFNSDNEFEFELESTKETENPIEEFSMGLDSTLDDDLSFPEEAAGTDDMDSAKMSFGDMSMDEVDNPLEKLSMGSSSSDDEFIGQFIDEENSSAELQLDSVNESNELDLESMLVVEAENSHEDSDVDNILGVTSKVEEFQLEDKSSVDSSIDSALAELNFEEQPAANEAEEFMKELVGDNEMALDELDSESDADADEFMVAFEEAATPSEELSLEAPLVMEEYTSEDFVDSFNGESESSEELIFDETSTNDSNFDDLMEAFAPEDTSSTEAPEVDADLLDLKFEDEADFKDLDSLDLVDKKLDELTEISDESLGELNDLLSSVQDNSFVSEQELDEVHQDK
ncbi:MAG: hypothetical protein AAFQ41_00825 [Cyanobacteria bacterium J06623_7]